MINVEELKQQLTPSLVAETYLGLPEKSTTLGNWYKSPFRNEKTASFCVSDTKGLHDFGTSKHYDVIEFVRDYFKIDFNLAVDKLCSDFGIMNQKRTSKELRAYMNSRYKEQQTLKKKLDEWFNNTYGSLCDELKQVKKMQQYLEGEALSIAYDKEVKLEYLTEYMNEVRSEDDKLELYRNRAKLIA